MFLWFSAQIHYLCNARTQTFVPHYQQVFVFSLRILLTIADLVQSCNIINAQNKRFEACLCCEPENCFQFSFLFSLSIVLLSVNFCAWRDEHFRFHLL